MSETVSSEDYHKLPGVSNSRLKDFIEDPRIYHYKWISGEYVQPAKDHFDFGSAVHEVALLGRSAANIVVIPDSVLSASGSRAGGKWKEFAAANDGSLLLKGHDFDAVMRCVDAVHKHPVASKLLRAPGYAEQMFVKQFSELGLSLRCKPDKLIPIADDGRAIVLDLKTTQATQPGAFVKSIDNFRYANQEYFYRKVLAECGYVVDAFVFVAVSVEQPHTVDCYSLSQEWLDMATEEVETALSNLARRTIENDWESETSGKIVCLSPPNYLKYRNEYSL